MATARMPVPEGRSLSQRLDFLFRRGKRDIPAKSLPEYQIAFKLYENGVTRDLLMDYGDFSLTAR
jgi:hypothetical protein